MRHAVVRHTGQNAIRSLPRGVASPSAYADNYPNEAKDENGNYYNGFDIGWAVDPETREPVHLPGVDFIRVYTALNQYCGWIGETSTEIFMARDMHIYVRPDQHQ